MNKVVRYMYIRDAKWEPQGCLAIAVNRSLNRVEYGFSVRNPVDGLDKQGRSVKFDRGLAQRVAKNRLTEGLQRAYIPSDATQHDITKAVLRDIVASGKAPTRAVRFAKRWLQMAEYIY